MKALSISCLLALILLGASATVSAQKRAYVPAYIRDTSTVEGRQFSWDKTAQSRNFFMIWGDSVGTDPSKFTAEDLRFDPKQVLDTMEYIYARCDEMGMINRSPDSKANLYKYVIVMYNTYGSKGPQGWANGWAVDDSIGAFWVHPSATRDGGVIAHEFTHSLQAMFHIDNQNSARGDKAIYDNDGLFYETHANFVRNAIYPQAVTSDIDAHHYLMLEPDWKFNYEGYHFLLYVHSTLGLDMVSRLWTEWRPLEYPLQTLRRLNGMSQADFNDYMFDYARRAASWNYPKNNWGQYLRESRRLRMSADWGRIWAQRTFDVLRAIDTAARRFYSAPYNAPQDYGYNVVPLYPDDASKPVVVDFIGHTEVNDHAGWRYGFVTEKADGTPGRFGQMYRDDRRRIELTLNADEKRLFLVVLGAPVDSMHADPEVHNTWNGNPKRFHYPYEIRLANAMPEGFQDPKMLRPQLRSAPGTYHPNGGGWVDNRSKVDASVWVGPHAMVLGTSVVTGMARIDGCAVVENATIGGFAQVLDNAMVRGGTMVDSPIVRDQCLAENNTLTGRAVLGGCSIVQNYKLGGNVVIDGDLVVYNDQGECNTGEYHVLTQYYRNELLPCGQRDAKHPENVSVNRPIRFDLVSVEADRSVASGIDVSPHPSVGDALHVRLPEGGEGGMLIELVDLFGRTILAKNAPQTLSGPIQLDVRDLPSGWYVMRLMSRSGTCFAQRSLLRQ
ncbi:MAG: hypothetical protein FGM33_06190 [Candidatus Kapabacteria bacterium]|nr:hypothetical protein [Candidatus Kapabacteria bacterium]